MKIKIRPADTLFSTFIRSRDGWKCQRCGSQHQPGSQGLHCSHYWGRGKESTRFDPDNADAICYGCHQYFHAHPQEHYEWKKNRLGERSFKALQIRANTYHRKDDKAVLLVLKYLMNERKK